MWQTYWGMERKMKFLYSQQRIWQTIYEFWLNLHSWGKQVPPEVTIWPKGRYNQPSKSCTFCPFQAHCPCLTPEQLGSQTELPIQQILRISFAELHRNQFCCIALIKSLKYYTSKSMHFVSVLQTVTASWVYIH